MRLVKDEADDESLWESWTVNDVVRSDFERISPQVRSLIEDGISSHQLPYTSADEAIARIADHWEEVTRS